MSQFNVEFFDRQLNYVHHDIIDDDFEIDNDFLSPNTSEIRIKKTDKVLVPGFIHLGGDFIFDGMVDSVSQEEDETVVTIKPLICLFDSNVTINAALQKTSNVLETYIRDRILSFWGSSCDDTLQRLPITVATVSSTTNWTLDLKPRKDDGVRNWNIANMLNDVICPAFERYGIVVNGNINFSTGVIAFTVGKNNDYMIIDADNPMIKITEFVGNKMDGEVNKLYLLDNDEYGNIITYYLHPNGTYNTTNSNRITPVVFDMVDVTYGNDSSFAASAADQADSVFGKVKYKNYVEFETQLNDQLVKPYEIKIGSKATIYHDGSKVNTMLTGIKYGEYATLTFGTVRFDYTKRR